MARTRCDIAAESDQQWPVERRSSTFQSRSATQEVKCSPPPQDPLINHARTTRQLRAVADWPLLSSRERGGLRRRFARSACSRKDCYSFYGPR
jgi:hypothetical protein